jgi:HK97 family phage portal protein
MDAKSDHRVATLDSGGSKSLSTWEDSIASDEAGMSGGAWAMEEKALLDGHTLMSLFYSEDWVFIVADLIGRQFSSPYPRVMKRVVENGKQIARPAEGHPIQAVLDDPAEYGDGPSFWYRAAIYECILGNAIMWYMKSSKKFFLVPTQSTTIEFNEKGLPDKYLWIPDFGHDPGAQHRAVSFKPSEILHVRRPNPGSPWWGLSPFIPGRRSILFNRYSGEFLNTFFTKGATPQVIIETEIAYNNADAIATLAKSFELYNTGRGNQRRPLVLPKGAKASQVNMTITDAKLVELVNQNREVLINLLAVPKHALGLQETGSLGSEEHTTALRFFWMSTIAPMLKRFAYALTKFMRPYLGDDHFIDFDTTELSLFSEDSGRKADTAAKMLATHTINEVRSELYELDAIEGGDVVLELERLKKTSNPLGAAPAPALPAEQTSPAVAALPAEPTKQADGTQETPRAKYQKADDLRASEDGQAHFKAVDEELARTEGGLQKWTLEQLISQVKAALSVVKDSGLSRSKDSSEDPPFDEDVLRARIEQSMEKLKAPWVEGFAEKLSDSVETGYGSQLRMIFSPQAREAVAALQARDAKGRSELLKARGLKSFAWIAETTSENIVRSIANGMAEGQTVPEIIRGITEKAPQILFNRARTIARTETLTAVSIGQGAALKNATSVIPDLKKVWITAKDNRVRGNPDGLYPDSKADHFELHGDVVGANEKFSNGLNYPRDTKAGSAAEVVNCRCTVAMVAPEDLDQVNV